MTKRMKLFFISLTFLLNHNSFADSQSAGVDDLIEVIKKNTDDYVRISEKTLADLDAALAVEYQIDALIKEYNELRGLRVHSPTDHLDESMKKLQVLYDEKVYVENTLQGMSVILPKIEACVKKIDEILIPYPEERKLKQERKAILLGKLHDFEARLNKRKERVDAVLKKWSQWMMDVALEAQVKNQYEVMNRLEVIQSLDKISAAFSFMSINFYLAIKNHEYDDAENILQGYSWLRSTFPFYFSDKITTQSQYDLLNQIKDDAEFEQHEMTNFLSSHPKK